MAEKPNALLSLLGQTWPAKAAKNALSALMAPGRAWSSTPENPITTGEMIAPAADLAGLVMGGSYAAAPAMKNASGMGIKAYHGSPHDFDRFDMSKIGTGEGAQAYGHGLYFAENPQVAQEYRRSLAPKADGPHQWLTDAMREAGDGGAMKWLDAKHSEVARQGFGGEFEAAAIREAMSMVRAGQAPNPRGRMYEVDINADPAKFLDWDKPLSAQPELIQKTFSGIPQAPEIPGQLAYYRMAGKKIQSPETSAALKEAGIPGIKYLDQGSRTAGDGSRNYVVFDDKLVSILKKFGVAGLMAPPAYSAATGERP